MKFLKMQVAGNDYVYMDIRDCAEDMEWPRLARQVSDRHFGIGADGLVLITASDAADCGMVMFNADGSEGRICGNALRCVGHYLYKTENYTDAADFLIETASGVRVVQVRPEEKEFMIRVNMGTAQIGDRPLPVRLRQRTPAYAVDVGNPHLVLFRRMLDETELMYYGPRLERHPQFPEGCNVEFCAVPERSRMQVLVWERGSGRTLSCGSGAVASFAAARKLGMVEQQVRLQMPGGEFRLSEEEGEIWLAGPAEVVFWGTIAED